MRLIDVVVPDGVAEGEALSVLFERTSYEVTVPSGLAPGGTFQVEIASVQEPPWWLEVLLESLVEDQLDQTTEIWCNRECRKFLPSSDGLYTLEQSACHREYVQFFERQIESYLAKIPGKPSSNEFLTALLEVVSSAAPHCKPNATELVRMLLLVQDFESFAAMMEQRALEE